MFFRLGTYFYFLCQANKEVNVFVNDDNMEPMIGFRKQTVSLMLILVVESLIEMQYRRDWYRSLGSQRKGMEGRAQQTAADWESRTDGNEDHAQLEAWRTGEMVYV